MQELEKILEELKRIKDGNRKEKLYAKYPPNSKDQEVLNAYSQGYEDGTDNFYNAAAEIIRKHMNDGWIPVDERMPENDDFVLATVTGIYNVLTFSEAIQLASYCKDDGWFIEGYPEWENPNVSAWRPLPEPYRPERSEGK